MKKNRLYLIFIFSIFIIIFTSAALFDRCGSAAVGTDTDKREEAIGETAKEATTAAAGGRLIRPQELDYLGAFRLPEGFGEASWQWGGTAAAYYPEGDPEGPDDGYPGSIFATGHEWEQQVSEISIPVPVISESKDVNDLNTAATLQDFRDIKGDLFGYLEIPRVGLEYLPKQGGDSICRKVIAAPLMDGLD